jgi:adenylate cyclase
MFDEADLARSAAARRPWPSNATLFSDVAAERNYNDSILRSMSSGVVTLDREASVVKLNAAACKILDVEPSIASDPDVQRAWAQNNPWLATELASVAASGQPKVLLDAEMKTVPAGRTISASISIVPLVGRAGRGL